MGITKEEIFQGLQGDQEIKNLKEQLLSENTMENFKYALEIIREEVFKKKGLSKEKYHLMKLFTLLSDKGNFINALQQDKELLEMFVDFAQCDKELPYDKRGLKIFGQNEDPIFSGFFYDSLMECLSYWGAKYNVGQKNNPTKFAKILDKLQELGVQPKIKLENFSLNEQQQEILRKYVKPTEFQQQQKIGMSDQVDTKALYQEMYKDTNSLAEELETNLKGEDEATEILDELLDASVKQAAEVKQKLDTLVAKQNELGEGMRKQIALRSKFINSFIEKHTTLRADGFTNENYRVFKYEMLLIMREITGGEKPKPPPNYAPKEQTQQQNQASIPQQQQQAKPQQQVQQTQQPQVNQYPSNNQYPPNNQFNQLSSTQYPSQTTRPQMSQYQPPPPQPKPQPIIKRQETPPIKQQEQKQYVKPQPKPAPAPPTFTRPQPKSDYNISPNKGNQEFNDNYENTSQSSHHSGSQFFLKGQLNVVTKSYEGQFIPYDERLFEIFNEIYTVNNGINRIKRANLRNRYSIFESSEFQIGFDSNLVFHEITNRYFLRIRLCFGNKTNEILQNFQYSFEGDSSMGIWAQEPIHQHSFKAIRDQFGKIYLNPKQQMYIPVCLNYNRIPYEIISGTFTYETTESTERKISHFILPCLLTKFMSFRDTSVESFKTRWEYKHKNILKSEQVQLNPKIIKAPDDFLKSFGPNNVLKLTDYDSYQNQDGREMVGHEFGLVFTLGSPQIEFLLKIVVFPNHTVLFQIIPYQSYQTQAEAILHTLVFIFCLPD